MIGAEICPSDRFESLVQYVGRGQPGGDGAIQKRYGVRRMRSGRKAGVVGMIPSQIVIGYAKS